jgi:hypothetical protein
MQAPETGSAASDIGGLARQIHSEYCKHIACLDFDVFRVEWETAAKLVAEIGAPVVEFIEAQVSRIASRDPEALGSPLAAKAWREYVTEKDQFILDHFAYCERERAQGGVCATLGWLISPMTSVCYSYRVAAVLRYYHDDMQSVRKVMEYYGEDAVSEFEASPSLQRYIHDRWPFDYSMIKAAVMAWQRKIHAAGEKGVQT